MSVYKRGDKGVFYMNFTISGARVFRSTGKYTKREAKQVERAERHKVLQAATTTPQQKAANLTLKEATERVYVEKWKNNKDGIGSYRRAVMLQGYMGIVSLAGIDSDTVDTLVRKLDGTGVKGATVNRYLASLKTILKYFRQDTSYTGL